MFPSPTPVPDPSSGGRSTDRSQLMDECRCTRPLAGSVTSTAPADPVATSTGARAPFRPTPPAVRHPPSVSTHGREPAASAEGDHRRGVRHRCRRTDGRTETAAAVPDPTPPLPPWIALKIQLNIQFIGHRRLTVGAGFDRAVRAVESEAPAQSGGADRRRYTDGPRYPHDCNRSPSPSIHRSPMSSR